MFSFLRNLLSNLPIRYLAKFERLFQSAQGKGWGTGTTALESFHCLNFIPNNKNLPLEILDIGANLGDWTADMLKIAPNAKYYTFEPSSVAYNHLNQRLGQNQNIFFSNVAIGTSKGISTLWSDISGSSKSSLFKRSTEHLEMSFDVSEKVNVISLDDFLEETSISPTIIKIDVEGNELDVLNSGNKIWETVRVIQFEFGGANVDSRTYFRDFWQLFTSKNFDLYRLTPSGPKLINTYSENDEVFTTTNYIAVSKQPD